MTVPAKRLLLVVDLVILATGFGMLLPRFPALTTAAIIVTAALFVIVALQRKRAATRCLNCGEKFDVAEADWCGCLSRQRTLVCTNCLMCFCKAPASYKERFWRAAPPKPPPPAEAPGPDVMARPLVMLVEDDAHIVASVQRVCKDLGYGIVARPNRENEAKLRPDLVLTGAEINGLSTTELINVLLGRLAV